MKTILFAAAASILLLGIVQAQPPMPAPDIERIALLLDLDEFQESEVGRVLTEERSAVMALMQGAMESGERPPFEEIMAQRKQLRQETLAKLQSVLTQDQLTKFEVLVEERPRGRFRGERPPIAVSD